MNSYYKTKQHYQSLLRAVRSESCRFGHTEWQNGFRVAPEGAVSTSRRDPNDVMYIVYNDVMYIVCNYCMCNHYVISIYNSYIYIYIHNKTV